MKIITVALPLMRISSGVVELTAAQAKVRLDNLKALRAEPDGGAGTYQVLQPIQFKRGERFGFDGQITEEGGRSAEDAAVRRRWEEIAEARGRAKALSAVRTALEAALVDVAPAVREKIKAAMKTHLEHGSSVSEIGSLAIS